MAMWLIWAWGVALQPGMLASPHAWHVIQSVAYCSGNVDVCRSLRTDNTRYIAAVDGFSAFSHSCFVINMYFVLYFQWFGNIVTMRWWDDLWLNEGFANTLMYFAVNEIEKDWKVVSS